MCPRAIFIAKGQRPMRPRHQKGQVEVRSDSKGKYYVGRYTVYVKDENDKEVRKRPREFLGYCSQITKSEAWERLHQLIFEKKPEAVTTTDKVNLSWFFENRFRPMREARWEPSTADSIVCDWRNYLEPELGKRPLAELDKFILQTHFNQMAKRDLSRWVVRRAKTILSSVFIEAVDLGFMATNPLLRVKLPKCKPAAKPILPAADAGRLECALRSDRDRLIFRMAIIWGPRPSEIFGLSVDAWKREERVFLISNTAYRGKLRRMKTKNDASRREVPITTEVAQALETWIEEQGLSGADILFPGRDGKQPMWGNTWLQKHVQKVAKEIGITTPITFQILRRSFSTRHRNELKDAASIAGHSEETARKLYAQSVSEAARRMVEEDEQRIFGNRPIRLITEKVQ